MLFYSLYPYLHYVHDLPTVRQFNTPTQVSFPNCIPNPHYMHLFDVPKRTQPEYNFTHWLFTNLKVGLHL